MALILYNTRTRTKEEFVPLENGKIRMFVCGPTVYNHIHIGNARTYVTFDALATYLRHLNYDVTYLQNITDIDDKIIARADEEKKDPKDLAGEYEAAYHAAEKALGIDAVSMYGRARDHIVEVIDQITRLIEKGFAYESNGSVYFSVTAFPRYGSLSGQNLQELNRAQRTEENPDKKDTHDFVLWKTYRAGEPYWESPWGKGRPGWHIEDTAISEKYFGPQYDLHGGAIDLIFPHHEAEIAQQEAASGLSPFVTHWIHPGFLNMSGEKMSKSLGNFIFAKDVAEKYGAGIVRYAFLSAHYRSPLEYSESLFTQSTESIARIKEFVTRISRQEESANEKMQIIIDRALRAFNEALLDDFNTPAAFASLFSMIKELNREMDEWRGAPKAHALAFIAEVESIFKLGLMESSKIPDEITRLAKTREEARSHKEWRKADEMRQRIIEAGYDIKDTENGTVITKK